MPKMLSRGEMEAIIKRGESVLYRGNVLTKVEHLPSEAELVEGDAAAQNLLLNSLAQRRAALDAEEAKIRAQAPLLSVAEISKVEEVQGGDKGKRPPFGPREVTSKGGAKELDKA